MMRIYKPEKDLSTRSSGQNGAPLRRATSVNYNKDGSVISSNHSQPGIQNRISQLNLASVGSDTGASTRASPRSNVSDEASPRAASPRAASPLNKSPRATVGLPKESEPSTSSPRDKIKAAKDKLKTPRVEKEKDPKDKGSPRDKKNKTPRQSAEGEDVVAVSKQHNRTTSQSVSGPSGWFSTLKSKAPDEKERLRAQLTVEKQMNEQLQAKLGAEQTKSATLKSYLEIERRNNEQLRQEVANLQKMLDSANQKLMLQVSTLAETPLHTPLHSQPTSAASSPRQIDTSSTPRATLVKQQSEVASSRKFGFDRSLPKTPVSESADVSTPSPRADAAGGDASIAGKYLERADSETERRAATPPRAGGSVEASSDSERDSQSAPGSPKKHRQESPARLSASVIAARISSLQRVRSNSATVGGMPKQLTKTPTAGIASSPVVMRESSVGPANSAPSSPLRSRSRQSLQLTASMDASSSLSASTSSQQSDDESSEDERDPKKRIEARRNYRKRTASEILGPAAPPRQTPSSKSSPKDPKTPEMRPASPGRVGSQQSPSRNRRPASISEDERKALAEAAKQEMRDVISSVWRVDFSDCFFEKILGKGVNSIVYHGKWKEREVALKVLRVENIQRDLEDFKGELEVMTQLRSPQIVHFYGAATEPKFCMVLEYCANGSLFHYMQDGTHQVPWDLVLQWGQEIAKGVNALHSWKTAIVHRDLKSLNLLLDGDLHLKVCDFGLSRFVGESEEEKHKTLYTLRGTYAYVAPEIYFKEMYSHKSDVYSMGIIYWEMMMRAIKGRYSRPYSEYPELVHDFQVILQATKGVRPTIPDACPIPLANLIRMCWSMEPEERPSSAELIDHFDLLFKDYRDNKATWDAALYISK